MAHKNKGDCGKNIWSKTGENPLKSRVYAIILVEKTVENVKSLVVFPRGERGENGSFPPFYPLAGENYGGKVDVLGKNPQNGDFSPKILPHAEKFYKTLDFSGIFCS